MLLYKATFSLRPDDCDYIGPTVERSLRSFASRHLMLCVEELRKFISLPRRLPKEIDVKVFSNYGPNRLVLEKPEYSALRVDGLVVYLERATERVVDRLAAKTEAGKLHVQFEY